MTVTEGLGLDSPVFLSAYLSGRSDVIKKGSRIIPDLTRIRKIKGDTSNERQIYYLLFLKEMAIMILDDRSISGCAVKKAAGRIRDAGGCGAQEQYNGEGKNV